MTVSTRDEQLRHPRSLPGPAKHLPLPDMASRVNSSSATVLNDERISAAAIWGCRTHTHWGGYYVHQEEDPWLSYRLLGNHIADRAPADEFDTENLIREFARKMQGGDPANQVLPAPQLPRLHPIKKVKQITWQGSAMAYLYALARASIIPPPTPSPETDIDAPPETDIDAPPPSDLPWEVILNKLYDVRTAVFADLTARYGMVSSGSEWIEWSEWSSVESVYESCPAADREKGRKVTSPVSIK
ncbi:hypothetical protein DFS34DRAFT_430937 [Phlyctochytrium arcticum]|nr:hypothetical protein DFS34DRAFT_430937 [Phlyctochytrium arcticum]